MPGPAAHLSLCTKLFKDLRNLISAIFGETKEALPDVATHQGSGWWHGAGRWATYVPEMLRLPHCSGLHLLWGQDDALEGPNPGALLDPLCRTDAVGQSGHGAGAEAHLLRQVLKPLGQLGRGRGGRGAAGAHEPAQREQRPVHGALPVAVVHTHVAICRYRWGRGTGDD